VREGRVRRVKEICNVKRKRKIKGGVEDGVGRGREGVAGAGPHCTYRWSPNRGTNVPSAHTVNIYRPQRETLGPLPLISLPPLLESGRHYSPHFLFTFRTGFY
jgi:hypothetical protein